MADESPTTEERPAPVKWAAKVLQELGLTSLFASTLDTKILCLQRFVRLFAYGASTLILAAYLADLGHSKARIGLFMTLTLAGDVLISFFLTLVADNLGRRKVLAAGALLMAASGLVFALTGNYYALLAAAVLGVITPSGNEIGPFRAVEESMIAHITHADHRNHVFAWYTLFGIGGTALGLITCGWVTDLLINKQHWSTVEAYRAVYIGYAIVGAIKFLLTLLLSSQCEADKQPERADATETAPLLNGYAPDGDEAGKPKKPSRFSLIANISPASRAVLAQLCLLFALDSFASGLAPLSWVTFYFHERFGMSEGRVGTLFFSSSIVSAASILVAASIAKRIGNVKTMVFTHLPSAICLALIGIPSSLPLAMMFVILRACTQSMDAAPRSAFLSAVVLPGERTAVMGTINMVKTASQSIGPYVTGVLAGNGLFWVAFLTAGCLKATYDIGMLVVFATRKQER